MKSIKKRIENELIYSKACKSQAHALEAAEKITEMLCYHYYLLEKPKRHKEKEKQKFLKSDEARRIMKKLSFGG